ncbi:hypothetical protein EG359_22515 (plasmid) [Chryseobacterium joostei]|uniref:Conjugal transfer protein n=1 Tax=Chryseobacterium joostei TaxID=112234 RepID=A0A1N7KG74_9FLAO|nr:hypothetical protein [Chryseobacterium joostei]AZB02435.1 hypothetical protein EG359_22515 [Chryseobacterium joostei]SIS60592.1 hypothetical protein SAMN05421768_11214 [Chryseobacterium joostei]
MNFLATPLAAFLAGGLDALINYLKQFSGQIKTGVLIIYDICMYLSFGAAAILVVVMIIANKTGSNVGFSAGEWAVRAAVAAGALFGVKQIFGI